ncbi:MAG TPA: PAS domain-containing protein [Methylovirgula sp.]|nr:PAS domain-containing protein [Methylovirgula sp.]
MRQAGTRELFAYWEHLRGERSAPERSEIDLAAIRGQLGDLFMLEADARFSFLTSGSRVNALFCGEQKSRSFLDLWPLQNMHNMSAVLSTVVDAACPAIVEAEARPQGYAKIELEILLLPLRHGSEMQRILGLISMAFRPTWLGLLPAEQLTLRSVHAVNATAAPEMAVRFANFAPPPRPGAERRSYLRLIEGGR